MNVLEAVVISTAGFGAGTINTAVGSGTLLTFPVLLGFGYAPVQANVSNTVGLVPGGLSGADGYRAELAHQGHRARVLGAGSLAGALVGAALLLTLPASAFQAIVPFFIACALVLVVVQPWLAARLARRLRQSSGRGLLTGAGVFAAGIYGGYFGAAQGILMLALLGLTLADSLQRINALKNVLVTVANLVSGLVFAFAADVDWGVALLIAVGSIAGGQVGAKVARRIPTWALRSLIVAVGIAAILYLEA
jgi:uncharacterized membrane protein YfcA